MRHQALRRLLEAAEAARRAPPPAPEPAPEPQAWTITLDYPVTCTPRYGHGKPPHARLHALLDWSRAVYRNLLRGFLAFGEQLAAIPPLPSPGSSEPAWINDFLPGLDAAALYGLIALRKPKRYFEIGSGNSTLFARRAIRDNRLATRITSIDPQPRLPVDEVCDAIVRRPLQEIDLAVFDELGPGDVLFVDGSHRCFMSSDVAVVFLDVLPRLVPGVLVQIHDVFLPGDYPPGWNLHYYSEQYLLAARLLAPGGAAGVVLPCAFVAGDPELSRILDPLWGWPGFEKVDRNGTSFWMEIPRAR
jgi:methyltransferase family protein